MRDAGTRAACGAVRRPVPPCVCARWMTAAAGPRYVDFSKDRRLSAEHSRRRWRRCQRFASTGGGRGSMSSEEDASRRGQLEKRSAPVRNRQLHWVLTVPSVGCATGAWKGGGLDGAGDARSLGIGGAASSSVRKRRRGCGMPSTSSSSADPEKQPPVQNGESGEFRRQ
jgi:hypothetical protein